MITQERLKHLLSYDPETGVFHHLVTRGRVRAGDIAGPCNNHRYCSIGLDGKKYASHHLAWFYTHGEWAPDEIDHKDHNGKNNAIANLRLCNRSQNVTNAPSKPNMHGLRGVEYYPRKTNKKFGSRIKVNGKRIFLGLFKTAEEAHLAYAKAAEKYYGEFAEMHLKVLRKSNEKTGSQIIA